MPKLNKLLKLDEFLNPKSMLTPGLAGGLTMLISSTLWVQFGWETKWTALAISLAISFLVVRGMKNVPLLERIIYCSLNTMIIFSMGLGVHSLGSSG